MSKKKKKPVCNVIYCKKCERVIHAGCVFLPADCRLDPAETHEGEDIGMAPYDLPRLHGESGPEYLSRAHKVVGVGVLGFPSIVGVMAPDESEGE